MAIKKKINYISLQRIIKLMHATMLNEDMKNIYKDT